MSSSSSPPPPPPPPATDILLSLALEVLDDILARLPVKEVVRTCCLSRAWASRWESVPGLAVRFDGWYSAAVVSSVLGRCTAPVGGFTIDVRPRLRPRAAYWLRTLADKRVRSLALAFDHSHGDDGVVLPGVGRALYACDELSGLDLHYCEVPRPPPRQGFAGFPRLTRLALSRVALPFAGAGALLERVIAAAPNLTDLSLKNVFAGIGEVEPWAIRAPKLRLLTLWMVIDNGGRVAEELPLLEEADVSVDCLLGSEEFLDTIWRVLGVKTLKLYVRDREFNENPTEGITWKFRNLRISTLSANFGKISSIMSIFSLLRCAPQIEQLHIEVDRKETLGDEIDEEILDAEMSDDLVKTLKCVSMTHIKGFPSEMCFVKLLLSKAASLESLEVRFFWENLHMSCEEACADFATYERASSTLAKFEVESLMETFDILSLF
ncbi:hypothetical protein E2562_009174 [Oryza meyeriana var. granulata]|uniref:F-box domain-containing protein n=1 Tax=Oryza meyeriana var. granulata TaxID=110450 RepID=A0A6G1CFY2_9ORYZ|nr:hypothetical protein E2562_009174 [Oryza meyeriana var. granulata]